MDIRTCDDCGCKWVHEDEDDSCTYCAGVKCFSKYAEAYMKATEHIEFLDETVKVQAMLLRRQDPDVKKYLEERLEKLTDELETFLREDKT